MAPHAVVDDIQRDTFPSASNPSETESALNLFRSAERTGVFLTESDAIADLLHPRLVEAWARVGDRFPDHLARNLLLAAGAGAAMRRKGDNSVRMDIALGPPWPAFGCAEAEFGDTAVLDAPRDLMDDIAVSVGRFGKNIETLVALVITDLLPNRRSEYWRIVQDIRAVLELRIGTVTVFALFLLVWQGKRLVDLPTDLFHVDVETENYRIAVLEPLLGRELKIGLAPRPWVDIAK